MPEVVMQRLGRLLAAILVFGGLGSIGVRGSEAGAASLADLTRSGSFVTTAPEGCSGDTPSAELGDVLAVRDFPLGESQSGPLVPPVAIVATPSDDGDVVQGLGRGDRLKIVGPFVPLRGADGCGWWPVTDPSTGVAGYVSEARTLLSSGAGAEVPQYQGGAARTGAMPGPGPHFQPTVRRHYETGGEVTSPPAIVDGVAYVGSSDGTVRAITLVSGRERWQFDTGDMIRTTPAVVDGMVFVGGNGGTLFALDASSGAKAWSFATGQQIQGTPVVADGVVVFASVDGFVYGIEQATGTRRWRFGIGRTCKSDPAMVDGVAYIGCNDQRLYALDALTGAERWHVETDSEVHNAVAVSDGVVYASAWSGSLYAVDSVTGQERWRFTTEPGASSGPAVVNGTVYLGELDGTIYALDATTGIERWRYAGQAGFLGYSDPVVFDDTVCITAKFRSVICLTTDGQLDEELATGESPVSSPVVIGDSIYVGTVHDANQNGAWDGGDSGDLVEIGSYSGRGVSRAAIARETVLRTAPSDCAAGLRVLMPDTVVLPSFVETHRDVRWRQVRLDDDSGLGGWVPESSLLEIDPLVWSPAAEVDLPATMPPC